MHSLNNQSLIGAYLEYRRNVDQLAKGSMVVEKNYLRYLLAWAGEHSFLNPKIIRPALPEYLNTILSYRDNLPMSCMYSKKILATSRRFFIWLADNYPQEFQANPGWIRTLKSRRLPEVPLNREYVSFEEILAICTAPAENTLERRIRAAAVFLYLSGMRIGAFLTMPILAVDVPNRTVRQFPSLGVKTKNGKAATTNLLNIPEAIQVIQAWDDEIRLVLPSSGLWFAPLSHEFGEISIRNKSTGEHRESNMRKHLQRWLDKVGLPYHSPHKFRHGHVHFGLDRAKSMADLKAVSLNVMHSDVQTTDHFYSVQSENEVRKRITAMGNRDLTPSNTNDLIIAFQEFLEEREKRLPIEKQPF